MRPGRARVEALRHPAGETHPTGYTFNSGPDRSRSQGLDLGRPQRLDFPAKLRWAHEAGRRWIALRVGQG